jgi:phospholipid transport system substrate-binding protein
MSYLAQRAAALAQPVTIFRWVAIAAFVFGLIVARTPAAPAADAVTLVDDMVTHALSTLGDKQISDRERATQFRVLLEQNFDVPRIARVVLGSYWDSASNEERQAFIRLFEQWIAASYAQSTRDYDGETIKVTGSRTGGANTTIVASQIVDRDGAAGAKLDWVVLHDNGAFKIININVEGVSLVMTERDQIFSVIRRAGGTVKGANDALEAKLADTGAPVASK